MNELDRREDLRGACHWCWCAAVLLLCALVAQAVAQIAAPPVTCAAKGQIAQRQDPTQSRAGETCLHRDMSGTPAHREEHR